MATSPAEQTIYTVTDLGSSSDGTLYAADKENNYGDWFAIAASHDGGLTWTRADFSESTKYIDTKVYPVKYCKYLDYYEVTHCYQVTALHRFEYGFQYPADRGKPFSWAPVFPSGDLDVKAYDLMVTRCEDLECIYVAMGKAGIFRRILPNGNWELIGVLGAHPYEIFSNGP